MGRLREKAIAYVLLKPIINKMPVIVTANNCAVTTLKFGTEETIIITAIQIATMLMNTKAYLMP